MFDWKMVDVLDKRWLMGGGHLREVVAHGDSTVVEHGIHNLSNVLEDMQMIVGMMLAHYFHFQKSFAMSRPSLFHNLLVEILLGIIIIMDLFEIFFEIQNMSGAITKNILFSCSSNVPIDFNLYKKFWALQDYFRNPTQCYTAAAWKPFTDVSLNCQWLL